MQLRQQLRSVLIAVAILAAAQNAHAHPGARDHHHADVSSADLNPFNQPGLRGTSNGVTFRGSKIAEPPKYDWYTSDMHIHASGCRTVAAPTSTTTALKQALVSSNTNIGDLLIWGDQRSYIVDAPKFLGHKDDPVSDGKNILHWDLEISKLPGSLFGHQTFLNLADLNLFKLSPASGDSGRTGRAFLFSPRPFCATKQLPSNGSASS